MTLKKTLLPALLMAAATPYVNIRDYESPPESYLNISSGPNYKHKISYRSQQRSAKRRRRSK